MKDNDYIQIVKTHEYYFAERKFHEDSIKEIDEILAELKLVDTPAPFNYDTGGVTVPKVPDDE
jgi:chaperonin cofactor prefoldin